MDSIDPKGYNREKRRLRDLLWVGSSKRDLSQIPEEIQSGIGFALYQAQLGDKHSSAKPLKGFGSAGVLEVVEDFDGDTYRGVYTVRFSNAVYVLHCFQKKSTHGTAMPKPDSELIQRRLKAAELDSRGASQ